MIFDLLESLGSLRDNDVHVGDVEEGLHHTVLQAFLLAELPGLSGAVEEGGLGDRAEVLVSSEFPGELGECSHCPEEPQHMIYGWVYKFGMEDYNGMGRESHSRKARKETLRTLFTIDTFEPLASSHPNKENKGRQPRHPSRSQQHKRRHSSMSHQSRSLFEIMSPPKRRDSTPINRVYRPRSSGYGPQKRVHT